MQAHVPCVKSQRKTSGYPNKYYIFWLGVVIPFPAVFVTAFLISPQLLLLHSSGSKEAGYELYGQSSIPDRCCVQTESGPHPVLRVTRGSALSAYFAFIALCLDTGATQWCGWHSYFVLGRPRLQISVRGPDVRTAGCHGFPQPTP